MDSGLLLSIVMPVYNAENYIDKAVESVLSQSYRSIELILVNDCSTDGSGKKCEAWADRDERVRVFHLDENSGAGRARNFGIEKATGTYLTFVDSDDEIDRNLYETLFDLCGGKQYDAVVWGMTERYYNDKGEAVSENYVTVEDAFYESAREVRKKVIDLEKKTLFGYQCNHLYKLNIVKEHDILFRPCHLYEDYFFNLSYIEYVSSMAVSSCTGYFYNKRMNQSLTKQFVADYVQLSRKRIKSMAEAYKRWGMFDSKVKNILGQRYLRYYFSALMRNNDPKSEMNCAGKRKWVKKSLEDPFYLEVVRECDAGSLYLKILQKMMKLHFISGCLLFGKALYIVRTKLPGIYAEKGQIH